jgi:glycosyltransferase involved in cell wall biosynthesis
MSKTLTLSIVIPVYNEEHHLKACLDAVQAQQPAPLEVIVVDNNCTDTSMEIARRYSFVTTIREKRQGRGYARQAGFNMARGDIIGRIDADSVLMPGWTKRVLDNFMNPETMGLTGLGLNYTLPTRIAPNFYSTLWSRGYYWSTFSDIRLQTMWGANMAVRRTAWDKIAAKACLDDEQVHEDIDISLLLQAANFKIVKDNRLLIKTKGTSYHYLPKMVHYFLLRFKTLKLRKPDLQAADPPLRYLGFWRTQYHRFISFLPGILFLTTSLICWPLDAYMVKVRRREHWLD